MPYVNIDGKNLYYREYGKGMPIVFLNGMMMSTTSWIPFADTVSEKYRMITVDLLDQGKSDDWEEEYTVDTQADFLMKFLNKLNLDKVNLFGMSYGGKVALTFAVKYQSKIKSLILSNTDSFTSNIMKEIGRAWKYAASTQDGEIFTSIVFPYMYSHDFYEKNYEFIEKMKKSISKTLDVRWKDRFIRLLNSIVDYDVSRNIKDIKVPTLIISSEFDMVAFVKQQELIHNQIKDSLWVTIKGVGHAALYEKPREYISIIMEFLKNNE